MTGTFGSSATLLIRKIDHQQRKIAMPIDLTAQIHQYLTTAPGSLFTQQPVEIVDHWEGDANLLWRVRVPGQEAVVKLFLDAGQARSRRQFDAHQLFAPVGIAPKPLWTDRYPHGLSRQLLVYTWSDGDPLTPNDPSELWAWAEAIGRLHTTPPDEVRRFSPHPINLDFYWRIEQGSIAQITKWLAPSGLALTPLFQKLATATEQLVQASLPLWATAMPTPVHGDLSRNHTLVERGRVTLLDWEMFGLGDPALDVARLLQREAQTLDAEQVETWLDRYLTLIDQPEMAARVHIFQQLLAAHNVIYLLVGLQQNSTGQFSHELSAALPFMQAALSTAIDHAATAFSLTGSSNLEAVVADFIAWLTQFAPETS
jgi:aminoglycoside phosphotransferase (APT) family kinase protein